MRCIFFYILVVISVMSATAFGNDIGDNTIQSTVFIDVEGLQGPSSGSGFLLGPLGYVMTAAHVVEPMLRGHTATVSLSGNPKKYEATLISYQPETDLALLRTAYRPSNYLALAEEPPKTLDRVITAGYPYGRIMAADEKAGLDASLNVCHVTALRTINGENIVQLDSQLNPGNSGGPVINIDGKVVGVAVATIQGGGINFAIGLESIKRVLNSPASARILYKPVNPMQPNEGPPYRVDLYFLRPILEGLQVELDLLYKDQIVETTTLKAVSDGQYLGSIPPLGQFEAIDVSIRLKNQDLITGSMSNAPLEMLSLSLAPSEVSQITFDSKEAVISLSNDTIIRGDAELVWDSIRAGIQSSTQTNTILNNVEVHQINVISFGIRTHQIDFTLLCRISLDGNEIANYTSPLEFNEEANPQNVEKWFGLPLTRNTEKLYWGSAYRPATKAATSNRRRPKSWSGTFVRGDLPDIIKIRKIFEPPESPVERIEEAIATPLAAQKPTPFLQGSRLLVPFQRTNSLGVFDLERNRFIAYFTVEPDDYFFAPMGDDLYLLANGDTLVRIDGKTLDVTGSIMLKTPFEPIGMWGSLGQSNVLTIVSERDEQTNLSSIFIFDTAARTSSIVTTNEDFGRRTALMPMENGMILFTNEYGNDFENAGYVKVNEEYEATSEQYPDARTYIPTDWTGDNITRGTFGASGGSRYPRINISNYRFSAFLSSNPLLWQTDNETTRFYEPTVYSSGSLHTLVALPMRFPTVVGYQLNKPWLYLITMDDGALFATTVNINTFNKMPKTR